MYNKKRAENPHMLKTDNNFHHSCIQGLLQSLFCLIYCPKLKGITFTYETEKQQLLIFEKLELENFLGF